MKQENNIMAGISRRDEEAYLARTLEVVRDNVEEYGKEVARMQEDIDEMLEHYHDNDTEVLTILNNTVTMHSHMKRALERNEKAIKKPYFGRIVFQDEMLDKEESLYIGRGGIFSDTTHWMVVDWRAPVANAYYENGLGKCSYPVPGGGRMKIDLKLKRTFEIENAKLLDYFDTEVVANDDLLTKYLAKSKQAVLGEIIATIQKEQNDIIRQSPFHNVIVQGVAGSGKTTVAMHRISYILYNYAEKFKPEDFYIVGSNRILLDYITGVLPDLDVYGIKQMTMEQLFVRLLYEDWDGEKYSITAPRKGEYARGKLQWFHALERFCERLEWDTIPRNSVMLDPKQFVEGFKDGRGGVYDERGGKSDVKRMVILYPGEAIERYIRQNPRVSVQSKILMLNERLAGKVEDEFLGKGVKYTDAEKKAIRRAYRDRFGKKVWKGSIFDLYRKFLTEQQAKGYKGALPETAFDVYDLAALAYLYKRVKETELISEAHHIVIDEAQDFGMMVYAVLKYCVKDCTYTIMGDVSQNIHMGYGLNDWEEAKTQMLSGERDAFCILKKSYRNTVEISDFAADILAHGSFPGYSAEPVLRHGDPVLVEKAADDVELIARAEAVCRDWQRNGFDTIAVICRDEKEAERTAKELGKRLPVAESNLEKAVFDKGIMVLPVEYTKGLEFDAVLLLDPGREQYPTDDGHAKLLYVAATRALHRLCVLHTGNLTGLIADPIPKKNAVLRKQREEKRAQRADGGVQKPGTVKPEQPASVQRQLRKRISIVTNPAASHPAAGGIALAPAQTARAKETVRRPVSAAKPLSAPVQPQSTQSRLKAIPAKKPAGYGFGDMPDNGRLRPIGHSKPDFSIRWTEQRADGLYLQSRYGILRLCPVGSSIVRVTFSRRAQLPQEAHPGIAVNRTDRAWKYRENAKMVELMTPELCIQADKATGALRYLTKEKTLLMAEASKEPRLIESSVSGCQSRLFPEWDKKEKLYAAGGAGKPGIALEKTARYISHGGAEELPFLISEKGYGLLFATERPVIACTIPVYGQQLCLEDKDELDFYFIAGKRPDTLLNACAYLCGRL
ncbi:MAG: AAA family ATPase [Firmicutes bacterium]|nr:AAA family ATPase [Bacillota bacterium]